jgi:hypothetical protein
LQDSAHIPFFMLLALFVSSQLERTGISSWFLAAKILSISGFLLVLGVGAEFLQGYVGRDSSWSDVALDFIGIIAGLVLFYGYIKQRLRIMLLLAIVLLSGCLIKPSYSIYVTQKHQRILPAIAVFDGQWIYRYLRTFSGAQIKLVAGNKLAVGFNKTVGLVVFPAQITSGFQVIKIDDSLFEKNALVLDVYSDANEAYDIYASISYANQERVRLGVLTIHPGVGRVPVDLSPVKGLKDRSKSGDKKLALAIVSVKPSRKRELYINQISAE